VWLPTTLLGEQPPVFVAGATLVVIGLFNPVRRRIQLWVDRRFNRSAYEAAVLADSFSSTLKHSQTVDEITARWVSTVESAFQPELLSMWVRQPDERTEAVTVQGPSLPSSSPPNER
jgi:hypothetical protein